jgi:hypothetical protein
MKRSKEGKWSYSQSLIQSHICSFFPFCFLSFHFPLFPRYFLSFSCLCILFSFNRILALILLLVSLHPNIGRPVQFVFAVCSRNIWQRICDDIRHSETCDTMKCYYIYFLSMKIILWPYLFPASLYVIIAFTLSIPIRIHAFFWHPVK